MNKTTKTVSQQEKLKRVKEAVSRGKATGRIHLPWKTVNGADIGGRDLRLMFWTGWKFLTRLDRRMTPTRLVEQVENFLAENGYEPGWFTEFINGKIMSGSLGEVTMYKRAITPICIVVDTLHRMFSGERESDHGEG